MHSLFLRISYAIMFSKNFSNYSSKDQLYLVDENILIGPLAFRFLTNRAATENVYKFM